MFKRILHPTDFSPASRAAFTRAVALAKADRGVLTIAHVVAPPLPIATDAYVSPRTYDDVARSARQWAQRHLDRLVKRARAAGVRVRGVLADGVAHENILKLARSSRADVIVIGTHGRTGLARFVLGSVAGRVVAGASCPVLTIRGT